MRTESVTSPASTATRLRGEVARARKWVSGRGRPTRLALIALGAVALFATAYWTIPVEREELVWLYDGRKFSTDAAMAIERSLAADKIAFRSDDSHRIGVAPARWADAVESLKKHGVEPSSLEEIDRLPPETDLFSSPEDRQLRRQWTMERRLKATIERYPGIRSADVSIRQSVVKGGLRPTVNVMGSVVIDAVPKPANSVIMSIKTLLSTSVPDLRPESVTISDRTGHFYLMAGDSAKALVTQGHAREEELREGLLVNLREIIQGVDVVVQVESANMVEPIPMLVATHVVRAPKIVPPPPAPSAEEIKANGPIGLEPEPEADPAHVTHAAPAGVPTVGKANVWVKVPRSYYMKIAHANAPNRHPSQDELIPYAQKTRELVMNAVTVLVPSAERGQVLVTTIHDDLGANGSIVVPNGSTDSQRTWPAWMPPMALGAGAGLGVALAFVTGFGMLNARRPETKPSRTSVRSGLSVDAPSGPVPGPSERVRDLVRRDPEAAAGVLQRWIGQREGGTHG